MRYAELANSFEETVQAVGRWMDRTCDDVQRPPRDKNVVVPGTGKTGSHQEHFSEDDLEFIKEIAGPTMQRLGIE